MGCGATRLRAAKGSAGRAYRGEPTGADLVGLLDFALLGFVAGVQNGLSEWLPVLNRLFF